MSGINMASLVKIPLILSSAITQHMSFTPPHIPPSKEIVHQTFNEWVFTRLIIYAFPVLKRLYWVLSFAEIATIASHATDSLSVIQAIPQHTVGHMIRDTPITFPFIFGTVLAVTGGLVRWWCYRTLGRFFTFQLSIRKGHHIVTTGPYAVIRHPSYTAGIIQAIGMITLHGSPTSWLRHSGILDIPGFKLVMVACLAQMTVLIINLVCRTSQEDEALKSAFGEEWEKWAKEVRYRLVPGVY
jgi:protein-S-isoprenylcysteine O-methyltransferase Ste14